MRAAAANRAAHDHSETDDIRARCCRRDVIGRLAGAGDATGPADAGHREAEWDRAPVMPAPPTGYVIGVDDVLTISVWREKDLSIEVVVLPDGKVTVPLVNEMQAAGLTVEELRTKITAALAAKNLIADAVVSVGVKQIKSRRVYIEGAVNKPGAYELTANMTITHLITVAGGLMEFAKKKEIMVIRGSEKKPDGQPVTVIVNYEDLQKGKNLAKNLIYLMPGDQVLVKQ